MSDKVEHNEQTPDAPETPKLREVRLTLHSDGTVSRTHSEGDILVFVPETLQGKRFVEDITGQIDTPSPIDKPFEIPSVRHSLLFVWLDRDGYPLATGLTPEVAQERSVGLIREIHHKETLANNDPECLEHQLEADIWRSGYAMVGWPDLWSGNRFMSRLYHMNCAEVLKEPVKPIRELL